MLMSCLADACRLCSTEMCGTRRTQPGFSVGFENQTWETNIWYTNMLKKARPELNIWIYTGYTYEEVKNQKGLSLAQVLVDGPFVLARRNLELPFRGSDNQRLIDLEATRKCGQVRLWSR